MLFSPSRMFSTFPPCSWLPVFKRRLSSSSTRWFLKVLKEHDPVLSLFILATPAFFVLFWPADPSGSLRKEIISFVALTTLLYGIHRQKLAPQLIAVAVQGVAGFASEATVFFAPVFIALLLLSRDRTRSRRLDIALISIIILSAAAALAHSALNTQVADHRDVCRPLLERGVGENICSGAIRILESSLQLERSRIAGLSSERALTAFFLVYLFAFLPFLYIAALSENPRRWLAGIVVSGIVFAPLYVVALDWGRWMSFHAISIACLMLVAIRYGHLRFRQNPSGKVALVFLGLALFVTPEHKFGLTGGWVIRLVDNITKVLIG